jgi:mono/diheme cytochrome c family protein
MGSEWRAVLAASLGIIAAACASAQPIGPAIDGGQVYARECLACHMADGRGVPGMNPALVGSPWVAGNPEALAGFVLTGGYGPDVLMARFDYLTNAELAALLTYVRGEFAGIDEPVPATLVQRMRSQLQ